MPTSNPLKPVGQGERSPTDPRECCDWANARINTELRQQGYQWVPTGNAGRPIELRRIV